MIEQDMFSHLVLNVTLVGGRIYPLIMKEKCLKPAMVYTMISENDKQSLNNTVAYDIKYRFQIDIYGESYSIVKATKEQVKEALYQFSKYPHYLSVTEGYESDTSLFRQTIDFNL